MNTGEIAAWVSALAAVVSASGVVFVVVQLWLSKRIAQSQFEDSLAREYRDLAALLPPEALMGENLPDEEYQAAFRNLFRYIDLSNEQVFLRQRRRVSPQVWQFWCAGIRSNLARPAFARAWEQIAGNCDSFQELHRLINEDYANDPATWR